MNKWLEAGLWGLAAGVVAGLAAMGVLTVTKKVWAQPQETVLKLEEPKKPEGKK